MSPLARALDRVRVSVIVGGVLGLLVGGVGGRLAMLLLRVTSDDSVRGLESDDGFIIGRITLGGTLALLAVGTVIGVIGALAFRLVAPSLIGPPWFRHLTAGAGAGAVVGSMLVHADGIDFTLLGPVWLAVGLFIAVPAVFGAAIGPALAFGDRPGSFLQRGTSRWRWLPLAALAIVPILVLLIAVGVAIAVAAEREGVRRAVGRNGVAANLLRAAWLAVAVLGLVTLVGDTSDVLASS